MDSLEVNKVVAAVLLAGVSYMGANLLSDALVAPKKYAGTAIAIDTPAVQTQTAAAAPQSDPPVALLLASADVGRGEALTKVQGCVACHSFNEGGKAGVGPNLYGVVGGPHAHMEGYAYSAALKGKQGPWTYDELNEWLKKPSAYAPGTKMAYAGLGDPAKRADLIDYLHSLSHNPEPLPPAPAANAAPQGQTRQAALTTASAAAPASGLVAPPPGGPAPAAASVETLLASADVAAGKADTLKLGCIACHSFNEGGRAGVGPNLYGVVGGPHAHMEGYAYSAALKAHQGPWSYTELDAWLTKPAAYAPGTKMSFVGIADPKVRADVIAYLRSNAANPEPLPAAN